MEEDGRRVWLREATSNGAGPGGERGARTYRVCCCGRCLLVILSTLACLLLRSMSAVATHVIEVTVERDGMCVDGGGERR